MEMDLFTTTLRPKNKNITIEIPRSYVNHTV